VNIIAKLIRRFFTVLASICDTLLYVAQTY